ncbi:hypothetical protein JL720_9061 [Aureococcus anophagefferens]|nr:hypothetical protein JL720_9061 [Aureococcus anophagefferens]
MRSLLAALAITSSTARIGSIGPRAVLGGRSMRSLAVVEPSSTTDGREVAELRTNNRWTTALRGGARGAAAKPPAALRWAYAACGAATTVAWTTVVRTTIRSNQPLGMMVPTFQHGLFARIGAMSAAPIIVTSAYAGLTRAALVGAYGAASALSAAVWAKTCPETNPLLWPGRVADGCAKSLYSLMPANVDDSVNVKYALLTASFLVFTGLGLGSFPLSVIPSWTARRLRGAFPCWTLLAAANCLTLKEAAEDGSLLKDETCKTLAGGVAGFGGVYLASKAGAVFLDPSFPKSYHAVVMSPAWATAAIVLVAFTLKPDTAAARLHPAPVPPAAPELERAAPYSSQDQPPSETNLDRSSSAGESRGRARLEGPTEAELFASGFTEDVIDCCFLSADDVRARLEVQRTKRVSIGGDRTVDYGAVCMRGLYPSDLDKPCQDAFCVKEATGAHWFMIFDGHGSAGHHCADFAKEALESVAAEVLERDPDITVEELLVQTNEAGAGVTNALMHEAVDTSESGTTAVSLLVLGSTLYCSNVGDSRCILGRRDAHTGRVAPAPLSVDQTCYRVDERQRVQRMGGRVLSIGQIEGRVPLDKVWKCDLGAELDEEGDPPRIWLADAFRPGCSFSRSLGDKVTSHDLGDADHFAVVASDGVWELLTDQNVLDMCAAAGDPSRAAHAIAAAAYKEWYEQEGRVDDISLVVLFFGVDGVSLHDLHGGGAARDAKSARSQRDYAPRASLVPMLLPLEEDPLAEDLVTGRDSLDDDLQ